MWRRFKSRINDLLKITIWVLVIIISLLFARLFSDSLYEQIEVSGLVLTFVGLLTTYLGIELRQKEFNEQTFISRPREWIKRLLYSEPVIIDAKTATISVSGINPTVEVVKNQPSDASIEERILILEEILRDHSKLISEINKDCSQIKDLIEKKTLEIKNESKELFMEVDQRLKKLAVGDLNLQLMGLFWIAIGFIFSTFSFSIEFFLDNLFQKIINLPAWFS